ncbi:aldehyde dehydrogenase family protein [Halobacteriovorax sp. ZH4_bin.1]|uniref:aldehyde dehydrogenase family protein n=1 Tax=unclassified Halobacteriovorax TaxID=2639665 RepID=UPI0037217FD6
MQEIKLYINGEIRPSSSGEMVDSIDPSNGELVAKVHIPSTQDLEDAVQAAKSAFYNKEWRNKTATERSEILLKISEILKERKRDFISQEIKDSGSTFRKAAADVHNSISFFKVMSKVTAKFNFEAVDENATRAGFSKNTRRYEPVGVCTQIIPWNLPLQMAAWKIGPILATGCTTVLKSAVETPVTAMMLAEVLIEAGVPKGVVNIVTGGAKEGAYLVNHKDISKVAFTGSTSVGREIIKQSADGIKNTTLELGGKSANIILNDADLEIAVDGSLFAFLYHSGQACTSGTRLLIQEGIYDEFMAKFKERIAQVIPGPTTEKTTGLGPVVSEKQFNSVMNYINKTKEEGATLVYGGERVTENGLDKGYYIQPTAFEITPDNTIWHEEIFGPVVGITKFSTEEEAISLANNSIYGLAGAVWSKNEDRALNIAKEIEAGTVWINEYHLLNPGMPFGGFKQSGLGREMGEEGIKAYLEVKHLWESDCNTREGKMWFDAIF